MPIAPLLIAASATIAGLLGCVHLLYTFHGNKFDPRDAALSEALQRVSPVISRETTMARAAKGFHASHSFGVMLFALVYGYLALWHFGFLLQSPFLLGLGMALLGGYLALAKRYWFSIPLRGIGLAFALYATGLLAALGST